MMNQLESIYYDPIVDGYNGLYIEQRYNEAVSGVDTHALVYMNIKNFRYYNTKYGYVQGNEILKMIYHRTVEYFEGYGVVAHLYGDNFAILVRYEDLDDLIYVKWVKLVDVLYRIDHPCIYREMFLSFGLYQMAPENKIAFHDALTLANLCRKSGRSLFLRNSFIEIYDSDFFHKYMDYHELEIRTADAYKNYEFSVFLQPKVDLKTNKIAGAEALLRWQDKDGLFVPVPDFLPILNENGYIELIDLDSFDVICKMLDERIKADLPVVPISFNLSKSSFYSTDMIKDYTDIFDKYTIPKSLIEFELMESISLDDTARMTEIIAQIQSAGFKCSLDDFGSGYSSFTVLLNAQLSAVKMDRQFFLNNLNGDSKLIIETVINLLKSLHMIVIAEGVEKQEHVDFLRECGCDQVQGYYFYKPMPLDEFIVVLDESI